MMNNKGKATLHMPVFISYLWTLIGRCMFDCYLAATHSAIFYQRFFLTAYPVDFIPQNFHKTIEFVGITF